MGISVSVSGVRVEGSGVEARRILVLVAPRVRVEEVVVLQLAEEQVGVEAVAESVLAVVLILVAGDAAGQKTPAPAEAAGPVAGLSAARVQLHLHSHE